MVDHLFELAAKLACLLRQLSKGSVDIIFWRFVQLFVSITDKTAIQPPSAAVCTSTASE
jgi:hypothetical protein